MVSQGREYSPELPDPNLIIRTSGEIRLPGFLLWQSATANLTSRTFSGPCFVASISCVRFALSSNAIGAMDNRNNPQVYPDSIKLVRQ
jgi:hypothetical protein